MIFDEFDPFPEERERFEKIERPLALFGILLAVALIGGIVNGKDVWIMVITAVVAAYGFGYLILIFRRIDYNERKRVRFAERHPHQARWL